MSVDPLDQASTAVFLAAQRMPDDVGRAHERIVYLSDAKRHRDLAASSAFADGQIHGYDAAQEEGLKLIAAERANYEGAMADLAALVNVARKAVARVKIAGGVTFGVDVAIEPLERFLDSNHPVNGEQPKSLYFIRRVDSEDVDGELEYCLCDGPNDWTLAEDYDHDRGPVEYQIVRVGPVVASRTYGDVVPDVEEVAS